ncbi:WRKY transcription factor [Musa troglodytarum]|uniref:WRKY transcription factor n=1 Tax=Musa troglodytarum TaxID=320322 RepID=A0A9E7I4Z2_9LILI|nr:WRKY transcription factor [Musa troglodytarum]
MDDDNWDLSAVVRSCRPSGAAATTTSSSDTFSLLPPHSRPLLAAEGGKGGAFVLLPDVYQRRTSAPGLEELYNSSFLKGWLPRSTTTTSPLAAVGGSLQPPPCRRADRPVSRIHRSRRRENFDLRIGSLMGFQEEPTEEGGVPRPGRRPLLRCGAEPDRPGDLHPHLHRRAQPPHAHPSQRPRREHTPQVSKSSRRRRCHGGWRGTPLHRRPRSQSPLRDHRSWAPTKERGRRRGRGGRGGRRR